MATDRQIVKRFLAGESISQIGDRYDMRAYLPFGPACRAPGRCRLCEKTIEGRLRRALSRKGRRR